MSDINANIVVTQNEITISTTNDEIVITPNPLNMNIFTNDSAPGGFPGDLQYNANGVLGGVPTANYVAGNLRLGNSTNLKITGGSNAYFLQTDGTGNLTWAPGTANVSGNGTSAGANNQIQLTDGSGNFKSAPGFTLDTASNLFSAPGNAYFESNVTADYYFGNGAFLTGIDTSQIQNGNSNVKVLLNGPILISSNGNVNTMSITDSIISIEPQVVITQALTLKKDNLGSDLLFIESYNNSNVLVNGIETRRYRGDTGNPLTVQSGDEIYAIDHRAQYTNGSFNQSTLAGSNTVVTAVNANGNMSVNTTMYASYTNSNLILDYSNIVANGDVTANLYTGNANGLSNIPGANVTGQVANALIAGTVYTNAQPNITSVGNLSSLVVTGNADTGNLNTTQITASANVTSPQFISNVSTGTSPLTVQSNTVVANLNANLLNGFDTSTNNTANTIALRDSNGNISANYFIGNGSQLTGIDTSLISNGNSNVKVYANSNIAISSNGVANVVVFTDSNMFITGNANISGNILSGNANLGNVVVENLTVEGLSDLGPVGNITISGGDNLNVLATDGSGNLTWRDIQSEIANAAGSNTQVQFNNDNLFGASANFTYDSDTDTLTVNGTANLGILITGNANISGNILSGNANLGNLATANFFTGTLTTNAQPNITSVGTLTSLNVSGNANITNTNLVKFGETVVNAGNTGTATLTPDVAAGTIFNYTLTGNITINTLANAVAGTSVVLILTQDSNGSRLLTSNMKFAGNIKTLTPTANAIDIMSVFYDGNTYYAALQRNWK